MKYITNMITNLKRKHHKKSTIPPVFKTENIKQAKQIFKSSGTEEKEATILLLIELYKAV